MAHLDVGDLDKDPMVRFAAWFEAALAQLAQPEAAALATADASGAPSVRMVLLKACDERGFTFFTNLASRKGMELKANPRAALALWWPPLGRQVRAEGRVEVLEPTESDAYFATRPRRSQLAAHASAQSSVIFGREALDIKMAELDMAFQGRAVDRPAHWGGLRLVPEVVEFWEHREDRLHDRLCYRLERGQWRVVRLAP
ncbi:MAG: pyridoxamine 5'-phosphate oxidase [Acidimicrobiales bacterium]